MKKIYITLSILIVGSSLVLFADFETNLKVTDFNSTTFHKLNTGGASAGNTGAPSESNCTTCHVGSVQNGNTINILDWGTDELYIPGETYNVTLDLTNGSTKNGFQLVALKNSDNTNAGEIIASDGLRTKTLNGFTGRIYLSHKAAGVDVTQWSFQWTAPSEPQGPVTFYVATNKSNSNGQTSGDLIYLSQHTFDGPGDPASISEYDVIKNSLSIRYNTSKKGLQINFDTELNEKITLSLHSLTGQLVQTDNLGLSYPGDNERFIPLNIDKTGIYLVNFFVGNKGYSAKVMVE